jgi:hypothetical protein
VDVNNFRTLDKFIYIVNIYPLVNAIQAFYNALNNSLG